MNNFEAAFAAFFRG